MDCQVMNTENSLAQTPLETLSGKNATSLTMWVDKVILMLEPQGDILLCWHVYDLQRFVHVQLTVMCADGGVSMEAVHL